jgi:hypothetical protein
MIAEPREAWFAGAIEFQAFALAGEPHDNVEHVMAFFCATRQKKSGCASAIQGQLGRDKR